jgi:hypothetical protein
MVIATKPHCAIAVHAILATPLPCATNPRRARLARTEFLPFGVLVSFSPQSVGSVGEIADNPNGHIAPAQRPDSSDPACTCDQPSVAVNDDWIQQPHLPDAGGEAAQVANVLPVPSADSDFFHLHWARSLRMEWCARLIGFTPQIP